MFKIEGKQQQEEDDERNLRTERGVNEWFEKQNLDNQNRSVELTNEDCKILNFENFADKLQILLAYLFAHF